MQLVLQRTRENRALYQGKKSPVQFLDAICREDLNPQFYAMHLKSP